MMKQVPFRKTMNLNYSKQLHFWPKSVLTNEEHLKQTNKMFY